MKEKAKRTEGNIEKQNQEQGRQLLISTEYFHPRAHISVLLSFHSERLSSFPFDDLLIKHCVAYKVNRR